ncbi:MAG: NAD-dependent epimerase/dehydratase [Solirubrobacterales bacterium]|nr:NAD-dependent epimerase/dehydratase [Solirubrobacterales bacterium]
MSGRALVTGCAGFIGSHLSERLLADGWEVDGVDAITDYYSTAIKRDNLRDLLDHPRFTFHHVDLASVSSNALVSMLDAADTVWHLAGQPGVRASFGQGFDGYVYANVIGTQRLLEAAAGIRLHRFVYASSSSVYGNAVTLPTTEDSPLRPVSPYGMTKVATETLATTYFDLVGIPVVGLRYFTAYGPRQRPDMAFSRFIAAGLNREPLRINGTGEQVRDFTYVDDIVEATIAAGERGCPGGVYNVGGGQPIRLNDAVRTLARVLGIPLTVEHRPAPRGDARMTTADVGRCRRDLGAVPCTPLERGLADQVQWTLGRVATGVAAA